MSDVAQKAPSSPRTLKPMEFVVFGRVERVRRNDNKYYTTVICPAKDAYSKPKVVEIRSKDRIGSPEDEVRVLCEIDGFQTRQMCVDKETGERKEWWKQIVIMEVIE
ncbi:single-stranded DNA-binding protein [Candidatus Dojkabacteria bacterium]|uniref:Single-stranded DNA-binding protein n=1 Tax=Candidatus Dojkabacteria bacterium TaxID=2099670 RepID=A0A5C7J3W1_9BACT|nr:MAG: single-stranded DNA-binding protein [Candidatus Dojkabacteria bacterium]